MFFFIVLALGDKRGIRVYVQGCTESDVAVLVKDVS